MAKIITIAQQKGGAGKTSLAAHLAAYWASNTKGIPKNGSMVEDPNHRAITLMDLDPQGSLSTWFQTREERGVDTETLSLRGGAGWKVNSEIQSAQKHSDLIIIDSPPHSETSTRIGIRHADIVVVPLQLSPMDIWATRTTMDLIKKEKRPVLMVFNRVPPRGRLATDLKDRLQGEDLPIARSTLGNRAAYASSLMTGKGVTETDPRSLAATEIRDLAKEVLKRIK